MCWRDRAVRAYAVLVGANAVAWLIGLVALGITEGEKGVGSRFHRQASRFGYLVRMPRRLRATAGGMVYHVLNWGVGRAGGDDASQMSPRHTAVYGRRWAWQ
jgi:hypothetical protein